MKKDWEDGTRINFLVFGWEFMFRLESMWKLIGARLPWNGPITSQIQGGRADILKLEVFEGFGFVRVVGQSRAVVHYFRNGQRWRGNDIGRQGGAGPVAGKRRVA